MKNTKLYKVMIKGTISLYEALINEKLNYNSKTNSIIYKKSRQIVTEKVRQKLIADIEEACDDLCKLHSSTTH